MLNSTGRVIGIAAFTLPSGESLNFAIPVNYARGLLEALEISENKAPITTWSATGVVNSVFESTTGGGGISGRWKSSSGSLFLINDYADQVKITNDTSPQFTYDAHWEGEYVLVRVYGPDNVNEWVLYLRDSDHLLLVNVDWSKESDEERQRKIERELRQPDRIWIKMY